MKCRKRLINDKSPCGFSRPASYFTRDSSESTVIVVGISTSRVITSVFEYTVVIMTCVEETRNTVE